MTRRVYVPAVGLSSWQALLTQPDRHWKRGASAFETAVFWEQGARTPRGLHPKLATILDQHPAWHGSSVLAAFPEHGVQLPGGSRASQNDVWALLNGATGLLSLAVEGKAGEPFANTVGEWLNRPTDGRRKRLEYLRETLGLQTPVDDELRYQLLHRAASAILEAGRVGAKSAGMVVLSFRDDPRSKQDFARFAEAQGAEFLDNALCWSTTVRFCPFFLAWLDLPTATDHEIASVTA